MSVECRHDSEATVEMRKYKGASKDPLLRHGQQQPDIRYTSCMPENQDACLYTLNCPGQAPPPPPARRLPIYLHPPWPNLPPPHHILSSKHSLTLHDKVESKLRASSSVRVVSAPAKPATFKCDGKISSLHAVDGIGFRRSHRIPPPLHAQ